MSQSETFMLIILGFAIAAFLALIIGRLAWKLALRIGARRAMRNVPSTVAELQTDRDRLRADHAMMAKKLEVRVDDMRMRSAELAAEVSRHRNRVENLMQDVKKRDAGITERDTEIIKLRQTVSTLQMSLEAKEKELLEALKPPEEPPVQDRLQNRINELTSLSDQISKQREGTNGEAPQISNGVLVKPANSTSFQPEVLQTKIVEVEQAASQLQDELKRLEDVWPENEVPTPSAEKASEEAPKRGITNVISLARRIKALQKTIEN
jgi:chromosome segregation ATPase